MKKTKFFAWGGIMFALCAMLAACSSKDTTVIQEIELDIPDGSSGTMKYAAFYGAVYRDNGAYLDPASFSGVKVTTGDQTTTTDANGYYQFDRVKTVNGRAVLKFEKQGFMTVVRSVPVQENMRLDVTMKECEVTAAFPSSAVKTLTLNTGNYSEKMIVDLPGDCYVTENGTAYSGSVTAEAVYLDPDDATFASQMPGDLSAVREDQSAAQLISYGMVAVDLKGAGGEKLNLAPGQKATLSFPIPDRFKENPPATIPLWSFNEGTGLWEEEGVATLTGSLYIGQVEHFSWHNLDHPMAKATVNVTVKNSKGKTLAGVPVDVSGQRIFYTDQNGKLKCDIPNDCDIYFRVPSEYYGNYAAEDPTKEVKQNVNLGGGVTQDITLTIPAANAIISGKVSNTGGGSKVCNLTLSYCKEGWGWMQTKPVISDINGNYLQYAPEGVTGNAKLVAMFADGSQFTQDFVLTGEDQTVNITVSSESSSKQGIIYIWNDELGIKTTALMPAPLEGDYWEAARVSGSQFIVGYSTLKGDLDPHWWESGMTIDEVGFSVKNYVAGQTEYENATFHYRREGGPHFDLNAEGPAVITEKDGIYTIKMTNAKGYYGDQMKGFVGQVQANMSVEFSVKPEPAAN
ncbi:MAG: hypothetical protein IJS63_03160 [Bacteroidaceae bacterium]|nr:hypothetical protein [Bacteroidaceae bacterium]